MTVARALNVLADAGRIRCPILPGMLTEDGLSDRGGRISDLHYAEALRHGPARWGLSAHLDTHDPATVGCLLALLREASRNPGAHVIRYVRTLEGPNEGCAIWTAHWDVRSGDGFRRGPTEGEAIAEALIALANEVAA